MYQPAPNVEEIFREQHPPNHRQRLEQRLARARGQHFTDARADFFGQQALDSAPRRFHRGASGLESGRQRLENALIFRKYVGFGAGQLTCGRSGKMRSFSFRPRQHVCGAGRRARFGGNRACFRTDRARFRTDRTRFGGLYQELVWTR